MIPNYMLLSADRSENILAAVIICAFVKLVKRFCKPFYGGF